MLTYCRGVLGFLGLVQEGLFRRNGKVKQQQELMNLVKEKDVQEITELLESNAYSVHEVATVLKNLLAEMPEPLLIESYYPFHCCLASMKYFIRILFYKRYTLTFYYFRIESSGKTD